MYQNVNLSFDPAHPLQVAKQGTFERWVETAGRKRRFLVAYSAPLPRSRGRHFHPAPVRLDGR